MVGEEPVGQLAEGIAVEQPGPDDAELFDQDAEEGFTEEEADSEIDGGFAGPAVHVLDPDEPPPSTEQLEISLPPSARKSPWKLPKLKLLDRAGAQKVDRRAIEEGGRTLEAALAEHGVETRLIGMVVFSFGQRWFRAWGRTLPTVTQVQPTSWMPATAGNRMHLTRNSLADTPVYKS